MISDLAWRPLSNSAALVLQRATKPSESDRTEITQVHAEKPGDLYRSAAPAPSQTTRGDVRLPGSIRTYDPRRRMTRQPRASDTSGEERDADDARRRAEELEDGSLDPDELDGEPDWWDEGSDDET